MRQRWALKVLVQQGGLANAFARAAVLVHPATGQPDQRAVGDRKRMGKDFKKGKKCYLMSRKNCRGRTAAIEQMWSD